MKHILFLVCLLLSVTAEAQTLPPAQATIDSIAQEERFLLGVFNDHFHPGSTAQKYSKTQIDSLADRSIARNSGRWSRLSDLWISEYVPPTPVPCGCASEGWGPCVNGTQTEIVRKFPEGCVGTCTPRTQACGTPAPASAIPASSVLVLYNSNIIASKTRADAYAATRGIPSTAVIGVALGTGDDIGGNDALINSVRTTINSSGKQWCVLAWDAPSRAGNMSITSALTFGRQTAYNSLSGALPTSSLYGYTGTTPMTDKGIIPCTMLYSTIDIGRTSTAKAPKGQVYMLAANDQSGQPRGKARLSQFQALDSKVGYTLIDNTAGCSGECPGNMLTGKTDVLGYFGSMFKATGMETNTVLPGAFTDRVTSTSGNLPTGLGQTPCTYELGFGFAGSGGTVVEPWQNAGGGSNGWLAEQFVNAQMFGSAYFDQGLSLGQAVWSSIKCPGRYLFLGDPMTTPKGVPTEATTPPPASGWTIQVGPGSVSSSTRADAISPAVLITAIEFVNFKPTSIGWGTILGTGQNKPKLQMSPDGYLLWNGTKAVTTLAGPMVAGSTYSFTVTLPAAVAFSCWWQDQPGSGGAQLCSFDLIRGK